MDDRWDDRRRDDDRRRYRDDRGRDWRWSRDRDVGGSYGARDPYGYDREDRRPDYDRARDRRGDYGAGPGPGPYDRDPGWTAERRSWSRHQGWRDEHDPGYHRNDYRPAERNPWDRGRDEVSSWFGDEEAMRRRRQDDLRDRERERWRRADDYGRRESQREPQREPMWSDRSDRERYYDDRDRRWEDERWRRDVSDRWERDRRGSNRDW